MNILAAINGESVVQAVIWLVIAGVIYFVLDWGIGKIAPPEPFNKVLQVVLILVVVVLIINALLLLAGHPFIRW